MKSERIGIAGFWSSAGPASFAPGRFGLDGGAVANVGPNGCGRGGSVAPEPPSPDPDPGRRPRGRRSPEGAALVESR